VRRFVTLDQGLAAWERASRNLRRALACAVAQHLQRAAVLLEQPHSVELLVLGAARTAEVIEALAVGARRYGLVLPEEVAACAARLRDWACTLKQPSRSPAHPFGGADLPEPAVGEQP
jgi:hypothetical protein